MDSQYVGVDWSSGAWVAIVYSEGETTPTVDVFEEIREVWDEYGKSAQRIVVDVPIGLCESVESESCPCVEADGEISRRCDDLARTVIGSRSSAVFTAPAREAARLASEGAEYADVSAKNNSLTGKGLTQQAASISNGIVEVEDLLLSDGDSDILVEGHPEVCFRAFNGALEHSKHTAAGVEERLSALKSVTEYEGGDWRTIAGELHGSVYKVGIDDVLDAFALALTACAPHDEFQRLPSDPPEDTRGLPMQMVYRSETQLR
jgi:predicted RNase H-like nuclease